MHICHDSAHPEQESSVFTLLAHRLEPLHAHQLQQNCSDTTWNLLMAGGAPGGVRARRRRRRGPAAHTQAAAHTKFILQVSLDLNSD